MILRKNSFKKVALGLLWWSSGEDSQLPLQGAQVRSQIGKIRFLILREVGRDGSEMLILASYSSF